MKMKTWGVLTLLLLALLLSAVAAQEQEATQEPEQRNSFADAVEYDEEPDDKLKEYADEEVDVAKAEEQNAVKTVPFTDPCDDKQCHRGETCMIGKSRKPKCICFPECVYPGPDSNKYEVCSKRNVTYLSECHLDRDHCLCRRRVEGCTQPGIGQIQLDYYGPCQELTPCTERELKEFPGRMREWLYIVMQQMAQHAETPNYIELLEKARTEANHTHAVLWKFCDLDVDPRDRFVTRQELMYTIQSLKALEHCFIPFLDHCDTDSDGQITLWEWGRCLGLEDGKIHDECSNIRKADGRKS